jgi:aldehyde:ferredoxin oxidoreductase
VNGLKELGTAGVLSFQHMIGSLPTYNYNMGQFDRFDGISGETMKETILKENDTCFACSVRCKRVVETEWQGNAILGRSGGPEYETLGTFGSYCGISSIHAVAYANQLCNEYGLDTIGTGATIAWVMECFENKLLSEGEIGFPAPFGDEAAMIRLVEMIARREGFGDILAEGSRKAAGRLGKGQEFLITSKGAEAPAHMPQAKRTLGLIYAVNPFGADHQSHEHDPAIEEGASDLCMKRLGELGFTHTLAPKSMDREKIDFALKTQIFYSFLDSACLCQFVWGPAWHLFGPADAVELIRAVTGWNDFSLDELMAIGKKRLTMMRQFNAREGLSRDQDTLPEKFFKPLQGTGPSAGVAVDRQELETWKDVYYELLGWDVKTGLPV